MYVPEARHGILPKTFTSSKRKNKAAFYSPAEEWVLPAAPTKELEDREFVVVSGASMHMVSKKDLNSAELEIMRISRSPTTMKTANGEVQIREEATVHVKTIGLIRQSYVFLRKLPQFFPLGNSVRLDQRSKTTSHQKWQEN